MNVMSFNMLYLSDKPESSESHAVSVKVWPIRKDMLLPLLKFHDVDICGSQELRQPQLEYLFPDKIYAYVDDGKAENLWARNCIIYRKSRFEVLESGKFWLVRGGRDKHGKSARYCQWAKFKDLRSGAEFYHFNLHNEHRNMPDRRLEAANVVLENIAQIAKGKPAFLTGDFNATDKNPEMKPLLDSELLSDAKKVSATPPYGPATCGCFKYERGPVGLKGSPIDFIFCPKTAKVESFGVLTDNVGGVYPSDHFPILARVVLPAGK